VSRSPEGGGGRAGEGGGTIGATGLGALARWSCGPMNFCKRVGTSPQVSGTLGVEHPASLHKLRATGGTYVPILQLQWSHLCRFSNVRGLVSSVLLKGLGTWIATTCPAGYRSMAIAHPSDLAELHGTQRSNALSGYFFVRSSAERSVLPRNIAVCDTVARNLRMSFIVHPFHRQSKTVANYLHCSESDRSPDAANWLSCPRS